MEGKAVHQEVIGGEPEPENLSDCGDAVDGEDFVSEGAWEEGRSASYGVPRERGGVFGDDRRDAIGWVGGGREAGA